MHVSDVIYDLAGLYSYTDCFHHRIVLEAAYSLNDRTFSDHIGTILLYAVMVSTGSTLRKLNVVQYSVNT